MASIPEYFCESKILTCWYKSDYTCPLCGKHFCYQHFIIARDVCVECGSINPLVGEE